MVAGRVRWVVEQFPFWHLLDLGRPGPRPFIKKIDQGFALEPRSKEAKIQELTKRSGHPEPDIVVPLVDDDPDSVGGSADPRNVVPGAAAHDAKAPTPFGSRTFPGRSIARRPASSGKQGLRSRGARGLGSIG